MRCVHCGKPLGRFRKATGEFCSEEHRDQYRDQLERAALERLLISRQKLTPSQKHPADPTIVAELVQSVLSALNAASPQVEVWPLPAVPTAVFPGSTVPSNEPTLRGGVPLSLLAAACQPPDTCDIEVQPEPLVASRIRTPRLAIAPRTNPRATPAALKNLSLLPIPARIASLGQKAIRPATSSKPSIGISGLRMRDAGFAPGERMPMSLIARQIQRTPAPVEPIGSCDSPHPCRFQLGPLTAFRLPLAPVVSVPFPARISKPLADARGSVAHIIAFTRLTEPRPSGSGMDVQLFHSPYSEELASATPAMLLLPGTPVSRPAEIENGIPDRLDELQALVMPEPVQPTHKIERPTPAFFHPRPSALFPEIAAGPGTAVLPQYGLFKLEKPDAAPLPIALSSKNAASFPADVPLALPSVCVQPFTCVPAAAGRLVRLPLPPAAPVSAADGLKKSGGPTDGFCTAPGIELAYPRLRLRIQPGWGIGRSRLVRVYAGVPARNLSAEVCGSPEPAGASIWQTPLIPRTGLVPAVWRPEQHESIQDSGVVNARRELAGIGRVVRFWESSRGIKGGLVVLSCVLAFGIHSTLSNPQPVSAITENAAEATVTGPLRMLQESIVKRAGVHLADDFRTGLHAWEGGEDWSDSWSYDKAGFVHPGRLALYSPSLKMSDYRMEFVGQINRKGLGWVIRATDVRNYVAVKLVHVRTGPLPRLAVIRYAVINGKEERHRQVAFPFEARADTVYNVRMEVTGDRYSLYIQDRIADTWEDDRFRNGGIGFFNAKGEDARLRWVRITYQYDWVGRICAALAG